LAHGIRVARPVKKGQSLCWDDVVMDTTTRAYALRKELEAGFVPGGGLG
jgi:predicted homoserine dehydrogenase-like protein